MIASAKEGERPILFYDVDETKFRASGLELEILEHAAMLPREVLDGRHHGCPVCGGKDKFRVVDLNAGGIICNTC